MKNVYKYLIGTCVLGLSIFAISYIGASFYNASFNIAKWKDGSRLLVSLVTTIGTSFFAFIYAFINLDDLL